MTARYLLVAVLTLTGLVSASPVGQTEVAVSITNGKVSPAEGVLNGYFVQADGSTICINPFVFGRHISCSQSVHANGVVHVAESYQQVWVTDRGTLDGYALWDNDGNLLCEGPMVWTQFRGPESYLVCE